MPLSQPRHRGRKCCKDRGTVIPVAYWRFEGLPWLKVAIDAWMAAELTEGHVLRPVGRGDRVLGDRMTEKVVWPLLQPYAVAAGVPGIAPHDLRRRLREDVPRRRWRA